MSVTVDLAAVTEDAALDFIESLASGDEQASYLVENSHLVRCGRGAALMKRLASNATPARSLLLAAQQRRDDEKAAKRARTAAKAAQPKPAMVILPSLFSSFQ